MAEQQRPHSLIGWLDPGSPWQVEWVVEPCPYEPGDPDRPCKWGDEANQCAWEAFDNGVHRPGAHAGSPGGLELCETETGNAEEVDPSRDGRWLCWDGHEPEECDGFYHSEAGHLHPTGTCGVAESFKIGYEDAWSWDRFAKRVPVLGAVFVTVKWNPDLELTPVLIRLEEIET